MKRSVKMAAMLLGISAAVTACAPASQAVQSTEESLVTENIRESSESAAAETTESTEASEAAEATLGEPGSSDNPYISLFAAESLDDTLKKSVNSFNWKLYDKCDKDENIFYSPYSIESAIALADLGAKGDTKSEIESVLGINDLEKFAQQLKLYSGQFTSDEAKLTTANSIWIDNTLKLSDEYEKAVEEPAKFFFNGEIKNVDFAGNTDGVKKEISEWVKSNTNDMIADYQSIADESTKADIINAIYFYGEWTNKFKGDSTYKGDFKGAKGTSTVDMMHQGKVILRYLENKDGVTAAALPYGDGKVEMDIFMSADAEKAVGEVWDVNNADAIFEALDSAEEVNVDTLVLPKFNMDKKYDGLKEALEDLGMKTAFSDDADFSAIAEGLKVSDINHRAKLEVDEDGSKAAAVTEMTMELTSAGPMEKGPEFIVDRPFIFTIRDKENGVILFTGRVNNL